MDATFWHQKWELGEIGFHEGKPNALLVRHKSALALDDDARVFVPLCGKSSDLAWLLSEGVRVVGAELSRVAVEQFFDELKVTPTVREVQTSSGALVRFSADGLDVLVGDVFDVDAEALGPVHAVYDRAAVVALPEDTRTRYAAHISKLTRRAPQLVVTLEYDQGLMRGPPFSVSRDELVRLYGGDYVIRDVESVPVTGGLRGTPTVESIRVLHPR